MAHLLRFVAGSEDLIDRLHCHLIA